MSRSRLVVLTLLLGLGSALSPGGARADDVALGFSATNNPSGSWRYGYSADRGTAFTLFDTHAPDAAGLDVWKKAGTQATVSHNGTGVGKLVGGTVYTPAGGINLMPGAADEWAVVRWTAPATGSYAVNAHFVPRALPNAGGGAAEVALLHGAAVVFDRWVQFPIGLTTATVTATLVLNAGETLDLTVGNASDGNNLDVIGLDATIDRVAPDPGPAGPVFTLGGQRFAACRWGSVFESIAFDPVNHRIASRGFIRDLCGNQISTGPDEAPGLAWDSRTGTYWQILNDRTVRRWSAAGALLDTVFVLPLTFTVPVSGPDTLESVRGIATDSNFVYVVDAGPNPGTIPSCEWFKFSRTGAPVKSSKSTDLQAHLGPDPDALVDDIVYVPFASPVLPGRLIVALEHTGLQVIDTNGNFVSTFRWTDQGYATRPLAALAGVTVDPTTGNVYLADNDTGVALVLTYLAQQGATSYVIGGEDASGGPPTLSAVLKAPNPGCDLPLWKPWGLPSGSSGNFFGLAYRAVDRSVYTMDYGGSGELWRFDPRLGNAMRVGATGLSSSWSLAYDSERDVLYGAVGFPSSRIVSIDPASGAATSLPNPSGYSFGSSTDLAWDSIDKKLYAIDASVTPHHLLRIDRDTGIAQVAGNTTARNGGLEFDASIGKLIAHDGTTGALVTIDPTTVATLPFVSLPRDAGFEGLAVVPVPANPGLLAAPEPAAATFSGVRAFPNPAAAGATIAFALPAAGSATVAVYDVAGRRVRELRRQSFGAGMQRLAWDGRDDGGRPVGDGVYFVRVETAERTAVARLTVLH